MAKTLIIIPVLNEGNNIFDLITSIQSLYPGFDIVVINDGSKDRTVEEVRHSGVMLINHPFNMGYGVTVQTGYKFAFQQGYDYLIQIDGDGQHNPECIGKIHNELVKDRADLVLGSRFNGDLQYKPDFMRKIGMNLFKWLVNRVTHLNLSDVTTGFQGMNSKVLKEFIKDSFPTDYPDADVIIMAHKKGIRIKEVPVMMYANKEGKSMHSRFHKTFVYMLQMIISVFIILIQKKDKYS